MSVFQLKAFLLGWFKKPEILEFQGTGSELVEEYVVRASKQHLENRKVAELFGVVVTKVKTFPTEKDGWMILDKSTKRLLHKGIKNQNEVDELCRKHNYIK